MATKIIQSRIQNKVDSYDNWMKSESPLLDGEIAIVRVPTGETYINPTTGEAEPEAALLMKVGDGTSSFAKLRWMCAKASDVYEWAKADPDVFLDWLTVTKKIASLNEVDKRIKAKVDIGDQTVTKYIEDYVRDNSVQSVTDGETNGTIKVDDKDVKVFGLGSTAYIDGLSVVIEAKDGVDHIILKDKAGTEITSVNASKFVQDSFLNDVNYNAEKREIEFTWAMGDGSTKTDKVAVADFVQTYTNGTGLILTDNMFSVDTATIATVQALEDAITNLGIENILSIVEQKSQVQIITWEEDD